MGGLSKQLSKVRFILNKKKKSQKQKALIVNCSVAPSTESLLSQLEEAQHEQITHLTLNNSLNYHDNARLFGALDRLVTNDRCKLRQIRLIEPHVKAVDYRRWCYKKSNFLRHVYPHCQEREIDVKIQGTLLLETPENKPQDVSSWLTTHFPKTIRQDADITSLWISLRDVKPNSAAEDSDVEKVFRALIDIFNNDNRAWDFVHCHVLYTTVPKYAAPQTEELLEVAQIYGIPLQVQWAPLDETQQAHGTWTRTTRQAQEQIPAASTQSTSPLYNKKRIFPSNPPRMLGKPAPVEDTTASTAEYEGSSGALTFN